MMGSSGDSSSPSSAESSFRELDDVFLQSQTRIWLGEVLQTRLSEHQNICDLLSDGELLFTVSKVLWNMLLVKHMELRHVKAHIFVPVGSKKSSGRYMPYSNVDSFLKVCKVLGLSGVDLFSPSDVVEKRDTRKVCICIRSLSKKARSEQLNVPDFDIVTNTAAMPTDIVECIRRSLELSTCRVSSSHSKDPRLKFRQKYSVAARDRRNESLFQEFDEAEINLLETQSYSSYEDTSHSDSLYLDFEESPEVNSAVQRYVLPEGVLQSDLRDQEIDKSDHVQYNSVLLAASAESLCLQYVSNDRQLESISSPVYESRMLLCDKATRENYGDKHRHEKGALDLIHVKHVAGDYASSLQNFPADNSAEVNHISHRLTLSEMVAFGIDTSYYPILIAEDFLYQSCMGTESHKSNSTQKTSEYRDWRRFPDNVTDVEESPSSSMSSVVGQVLNFDFDAKCDVDDLRTSKFLSTDLNDYEAESLDQGLARCYEPEDMTKYENPLRSAIYYAEELQFGKEPESFDLSAESFVLYGDDWKSYASAYQDFESLNNQIFPTHTDSGDSLRVKNIITDVTDNGNEPAWRKEECEKVIACGEMVDPNSEINILVDCCNNIIDKTGEDSDGICNCLAVESSERCHSSLWHHSVTLHDAGQQGSGDVDKIGIQVCTGQFEVATKDQKKDGLVDCLVEVSDGINCKGAEIPQKKHTHIGPLLKTVAKGTALLGVLFFLHLSRNISDRDKKREASKQSSQIQKSNGVQFSSQKVEKGSMIYPAETFKFR